MVEYTSFKLGKKTRRFSSVGRRGTAKRGRKEGRETGKRKGACQR